MHSATKMSHSRLQSSTSCQLKTDVTFSPLTLQTQRLMWEFQVFQIILWDRSMWIITVNESDTDGWRNYECIEFCRHSFLSRYALGGIFLNVWAHLSPLQVVHARNCHPIVSTCQIYPTTADLLHALVLFQLSNCVVYYFLLKPVPVHLISLH